MNVHDFATEIAEVSIDRKTATVAIKLQNGEVIKRPITPRGGVSIADFTPSLSNGARVEFTLDAGYVLVAKPGDPSPVMLVRLSDNTRYEMVRDPNSSNGTEVWTCPLPSRKTKCHRYRVEITAAIPDMPVSEEADEVP